ncbi:TrmH family RNA methyltransferase [Lysobacter silvisoli]|uniref:rRNA methyltransferase n=1 Tax=Lysobacter silvisoli TaxID=2293254 RepID=A0A371K6F0_9GAMM|nr:TrmH family RNA methyltransferase [Lysobacter silvisoli]RDZ29533.1 rRNA methyltransferase [Lysobacter silvisoli]
MRHDPPGGPRRPGGGPWRRDGAHDGNERGPREPRGDGPWRGRRDDSGAASPPRSRPPHAGDAGPRRERPARAPQEGGRGFQVGERLDEAQLRGERPARRPRDLELRVYGLNAVRAVYARRPQAIRKLYLTESRIPALQPLLAWCVANRVGYRVVEEADLDKLAASQHHEGVLAEVLREEPASLSAWLRDLPAGPQAALWLDGVGNPHNLGAILRSAAHFGVSAVLLPKHSSLALSGAAARVAEGGAEAVPMVRLGRDDNALAQLRSAGFALAATLVRGGDDVFAAQLPERLIYVVGAEGEGMDRELAAACDLRLSIPGSGAVESLNVASATAVFLAAWASRGS